MTFATPTAHRRAEQRPLPTSYKAVARTTGVAFLFMFVFAMFAQFFVMTDLVEAGSAAATARNLAENEGLFRFSIIGWSVVLIADVLVAGGLYLYLRRVNEMWALLTGWLRMVYAAIHAAALFLLALIPVVISGADYLSAFSTAQQDALVMFLLDGRAAAFNFSLIFFAVHLLGLGYLVIKSGEIPRWIGLLLLFGGLVYAADSIAQIVLNSYANLESTFVTLASIAAIGELGIAVWLLWKGGRVQQEN